MRPPPSCFRLRPAGASTPPVARPLAWPSIPDSTWSADMSVQTGARTVLVLPGSSTFRPRRRARRWYGAVDRQGQPLVGRSDDGRDRDDGVGEHSGGCHPFPLSTCPPTLPFSFSSMARKGNKEGDRS